LALEDTIPMKELPMKTIGMLLVKKSLNSSGKK
jgi:hypothetical protein